MAKPKQKKIATTRNPSIEAVVGGHFRLPSMAAALERMDQMANHFIIAREQLPQDKNPSLLMWIKGYEVSKDELKEGYLGHFAAISPKKLPGGRVSLQANKVEFELTKHPQRKYQTQKQRHPNWGHPVLRKIRKGVSGLSLEKAVGMLMKLHEEYPEVSIPGDLKLYLMIYRKPEKGENAIKKWVFEIERDAEEVCSITFYENTHGRPKTKDSKEDNPAITPQTDKEILGRFTAKAIMKKKRR